MHNKVYEELLEQITPGLERKIMAILTNHIGKDSRISREDLARQVFYGYGSFAKLSEMDDRKVRLTIAGLQEQGYPILSDSGQGGYWLGKPDEIEGYIEELEARRESLAAKIRALRKADKFLWVAPVEQPAQQRLF